MAFTTRKPTKLTPVGDKYQVHEFGDGDVLDLGDGGTGAGDATAAKKSLDVPYYGIRDVVESMRPGRVVTPWVHKPVRVPQVLNADSIVDGWRAGYSSAAPTTGIVDDPYEFGSATNALNQNIVGAPQLVGNDYPSNASWFNGWVAFLPAGSLSRAAQLVVEWTYTYDKPDLSGIPGTFPAKAAFNSVPATFSFDPIYERRLFVDGPVGIGADGSSAMSFNASGDSITSPITGGPEVIFGLGKTSTNGGLTTVSGMAEVLTDKRGWARFTLRGSSNGTQSVVVGTYEDWNEFDNLYERQIRVETDWDLKRDIHLRMGVKRTGGAASSFAGPYGVKVLEYNATYIPGAKKCYGV